MSEIDAILYEYVKFIHVIYGSFSVFRLQPLYAFLSTYAYSWIKLRRVEHCLIRFGIRWGLGGRCNQGWPWQPLGKFLNEVGWLTGAVAEQTVYLFIHTRTYYHPGMRSLHPRLQWMKYVDVPAHKFNIDKRIYFETNRGVRGLQ